MLLGGGDASRAHTPETRNGFSSKQRLSHQLLNKNISMGVIIALTVLIGVAVIVAKHRAHIKSK